MAQSWRELSPVTRKLVFVLAGVEVALLVAAQIDLARRPAALVNGSKTGWRLLTLVNLVGPLAYFGGPSLTATGTRRSST